MNTQPKIEATMQSVNRTISPIIHARNLQPQTRSRWACLAVKNISKLVALSGCLLTGCQGITSHPPPPALFAQTNLGVLDGTTAQPVTKRNVQSNGTAPVEITASGTNQLTAEHTTSNRLRNAPTASPANEADVVAASSNLRNDQTGNVVANQFAPAVHRLGVAPRVGATSLVKPAGFGRRGRQRHHQIQSPSPQHHGAYQPIFGSMMQDTAGLLGDCNDACGLSSSYQVCGPEGAPAAINPQFRDPQEYIFDGGDHAPSAVILPNGEFQGLDAEDTVMAYETVNGQRSVEPACRAAIYAPRFAAVRKVTRITTGLHATGPQLSRKDLGTGSIDENLPPLAVAKPIAPHSGEALAVIDGFKDRNRGIPVEHTLPAVTVSDFLQPYEDLQLIRNGVEDELDGPRLRRSTAAALAWSSYENVLVTIDNQAAQISESVRATQETVVYELNGKPRVKICKVASQQMADPGDEVSFTIRFDNVGDQPVKSIVIADSLPPRLTYVEGSEQSSLAANFSAKPNNVGSELLRWELEDELKPGGGGVIRFTCEVR